MWTDIVIFAEGPESAAGGSEARLQAALELAQRHQAHLELQLITASPPRAYGPGAGVVAESYEAARAAVERQAEALRAALLAHAPAGALEAHRVTAPFDRLKGAVAALAAPMDLAIVGQPERGDGTDVDGEILMGALFSGAPCLMLPRWSEPHPFGRRALIAWKGTPEAARAVLPALKAAESVRVLVVNPREEAGEDAASLARLVASLTRRGVTAEPPLALEAASEEDVGSAILDEAQGFGADLLVMGAYGHARLSEFLFGGVSRTMIRRAPMPVLMAH